MVTKALDGRRLIFYTQQPTKNKQELPGGGERLMVAEYERSLFGGDDGGGGGRGTGGSSSGSREQSRLERHRRRMERWERTWDRRTNVRTQLTFGELIVDAPSAASSLLPSSAGNAVTMGH